MLPEKLQETVYIAGESLRNKIPVSRGNKETVAKTRPVKLKDSVQQGEWVSKQGDGLLDGLQNGRDLHWLQI